MQVIELIQLLTQAEADKEIYLEDGYMDCLRTISIDRVMIDPEGDVVIQVN